MRNAVRLLALAFGVATWLSAAPAVAAQQPIGPGLGIRLLEAPLALQGDPRARIYIVDAVRPGTVFSRRFAVSNGTASPLSVQLYPDAADVTAASWIVENGRSSNELTDWITISPSTLLVPAGGQATAVATFRVPRDASEGERYAALLAEAPPVGAAAGPKVASRIGIRVYLFVGPGGAGRADFRIDSLTALRLPTGQPMVTAQIHNTGLRALDLRGQLTLDQGPGGLSAAPFPVILGTTLGIGQTAPVRIPLSPAINGGPWRARLDLSSGRLERQAVAEIVFPTAAGSSATPVPAHPVPLARDRKVLIPLAGTLIGLLLLALLIVALVTSRRRARGTAAS